jgi:hypothetical protein
MPRYRTYAISCVIVFSSICGTVAAAEPLPPLVIGGGAVPYDPPVGVDGGMCLPENAFCSLIPAQSWTTDTDVDLYGNGGGVACCSGNCQIEGCTDGIPGNCFGTCGPELTFSELQVCSSSADCGPSEFCTTDTEPCGLSVGDSGSAAFCLGVCLPNPSY